MAVAALLLTLSIGTTRASQKPADVVVKTVPATVYTAVQQVQADRVRNGAGAQNVQDSLSWMFHLVFESKDSRELRIQEADIAFTRNGAPVWRESYSRSYLEDMQWIEGAYRLSTDYFLDHVMFGKEIPTTPDLPSGSTVSWVRIPFAQPWFAMADRAVFTFTLVGPSGSPQSLTHEVALSSRAQKTKLRLPFDGTWLVVKGNQLGVVSHRWTGINGLTTFGWDFIKLGPGQALYRGSGRSPRDRYSYGAPALAAADGRVVHVRNDIPDYEGSPPRSVLEQDGDVFAGNLVVIDHGNGEFTLTCHLMPGSVQVDVGDEVETGEVLGRVGEQGILHFNLMNEAEWLEADGLPAVFSGFERHLPLGEVREIDRGNPVTGWMVRANDG